MIDVLIIGGGIASASAAIALKESGRSVIVLSPQANRSGEKIGESLSPAANPVLKKLGLWEDFLAQGHQEAQSSYSAWGMNQVTERSAISQLDGAGWQIDRQGFEKWLWRQAAGGFQQCSSTFREAERFEEGWRVVAGSGEVLNARMILDCSGRGAVFARHQAERKRLDRQLAAWTVLSQVDPGIEPTAGSMIESRPDGWWYSALLPNRKLVVSRFYDADLVEEGVFKDMAQWKASVEDAKFTRLRIGTAGYEVRELPVLADASTRWLSEAAGENWAAAGDAAAAFDPLSSHGMTTALWSGRKAALAMDRELAANIGELPVYAEAMKAGVEAFLKQRGEIYAMERRFGDEEFWKRRI